METTEVKHPKRYEILDAETGEKVSGTSFVLAPTGAEMHVLGAEGYVGPYDVAVYYALRDGEEDLPEHRKGYVLNMARYITASRLVKEIDPRDLPKLMEDIDRTLERSGATPPTT